MVPAGAATGPSLKFSGSTNTGISAATANTLSFDTNGTEQMNISTTAINAVSPLVVQNLLMMQAIQVASFSASGSVTINQTTSILLIKNNAGAGITVTVTFPSNPTNGQLCTLMINSLSNVVSLTYVAGTGGATFTNAITSLGTGAVTTTTTGAAVTYIYVSADNTWYRISRG